MQFVKEPTRRQGNSSNTLDLVLSNRPDIICNVSVEPGISDHDIVLFTLKSSCHKKRHQAQSLHQWHCPSQVEGGYCVCSFKKGNEI